MHPETPPAHSGSPSRAAAIALVASTVLSIVAVAAHPTISGGGAASQILRDMVEARAADEHVHGVVIAVMVGYFFGFAGFAVHLGLHCAPVRVGLVAYGIGGLAMIGAALLDGFITPAFSAQFVGAAPDKADQAVAILTFGWIAIQYLSKLGFIGMSIGMLGCSIPLLGEPGLARLTGVIGLVSGGLPVAFLVLAKADLGPPLLLMILAVQSIWNLAAAALLVRGTGFRDTGPAALSQAA